MKTILNLDIDSERTPQIKISKPENMIPTADSPELKEVVLNDIVALTETLCVLAESAIEQGFMPKDALVRNLNNRISQILG
jgi:hypothetical protein